MNIITTIFLQQNIVERDHHDFNTNHFRNKAKLKLGIDIGFNYENIVNFVRRMDSYHKI